MGFISTIDNFEFKLGETWLASHEYPFVTVLLYFSTLAFLRKVVEKPFNLSKPVIVHNLLLAVGSGVLLVCLCTELVGIYQRSSFWDLACDVNHQNLVGRHMFYYWVNHVFKYIELLDTVFLVLRGKKLTTLHVYHHAATLVLTYTQLWAGTCIQWLPIVLNLCVHVLMYYYYALHEMGYRVWWKKYLTTLQITQFIVGIGGCIPLFVIATASDFGFRPDWPSCSGGYVASMSGLGILFSYLLLFIQLYKDRYNKQEGKVLKQN